MSNLFGIIGMDQGNSNGGSGGDGGNNNNAVIRTHGFIAAVFGFALGVLLMVFFAIFHFGSPLPFSGLETFVKDFNNIWTTFIYGFIGGTVFSAVYNMLMIRRLNLFGLDRDVA